MSTNKDSSLPKSSVAQKSLDPTPSTRKRDKDWDPKEWEDAWKLSESELRKRLVELSYRADMKKALKAELVEKYLDVKSAVTFLNLKFPHS
jgi:uncharacterized LabA/DUF88 family protein